MIEAKTKEQSENKAVTAAGSGEAVFKSELDIVHLMWVVGLMNAQAVEAENALVSYGKNTEDKAPLLECLWAIHQISSTLKILGMKKAELLTLEMERGLNYLYKDKVAGERRKLVMGGLMQALKVLPAYFAHTQNVRRDTGRGLEPYVNNLRRWMGERPRPGSIFFYIDISTPSGLYRGQETVSEEEVIEQAGGFLVVYLDMARRALRGSDVGEGMKNVARIAYRMQTFFVDREPEKFWFAMIGLCEGIAGGLIQPDECIAKIFKTGAFLIKHTREHGLSVDYTVDYDECLQQMLFYVGSCKSQPVHISHIRRAFSIDEKIMDEATRALVHSDALHTALGAAQDKLAQAVDYLDTHDLVKAGRGVKAEELPDRSLQELIEAARYRLEAAGQIGHAETLKVLGARLERLLSGGLRENLSALNQAVQDIIRGVLDVKTDVEHKLDHGLGATYSTREFELRETVARATFRQIALVENYLQTILRRKTLTRVLARKPNDTASLRRLTTALNRYLNKSEQDHEQLREAVREADAGDPDLDLLYELARGFLNQLQEMPDRKAIGMSMQLLEEVSGALSFSRMPRESALIERCRDWLAAASRAGSVSEDEALHNFASALVYFELYMQRSIADPVGDNEALLDTAESYAQQLETFAEALSQGAQVAGVNQAGQVSEVEDEEISEEFREIFAEESEEIIDELNRLMVEWRAQPRVDGGLREIRRHFHTLKGNGRVVGARVLGELGWAVQDLLDHVLDGDRSIDARFCSLLTEVVEAMPGLVKSYRGSEGADIEAIRQLTNQCFLMTSQSANNPESRKDGQPTR